MCSLLVVFLPHSRRLRLREKVFLIFASELSFLAGPEATRHSENLAFYCGYQGVYILTMLVHQGCEPRGGGHR